MLTVSTECAIAVLDTSGVAVVILTIVRDLGASFAGAHWVVVLISSASPHCCFQLDHSLLLPAGSIADRFAWRKVFLSGIGLFAVAPLLCGAEHAGG
jgi:MFS family permease